MYSGTSVVNLYKANDVEKRFNLNKKNQLIGSLKIHWFLFDEVINPT